MTRDELCLCYPPFAGDETDTTEFADRFLVTRFSHGCGICFETIPPKTRVRALTERNNEDRRVMTFYFCPTCCDAMAVSWTDEGVAICQRTAIGIDRAEASRRRA